VSPPPQEWACFDIPDTLRKASGTPGLGAKAVRDVKAQQLGSHSTVSLYGDLLSEFLWSAQVDLYLLSSPPWSSFRISD
jgi:hypothetical protein